MSVTTVGALIGGAVDDIAGGSPAEGAMIGAVTANVLKVVLPDVEHYDQVYKALVGRVELFDVSASISMETLKDDTALPTGFA